MPRFRPVASTQQAAADMEVSNVLPKDYLHKPLTGIIATKIDFDDSTLKVYRGRYACVLDNVMTPEECSLLIKAAEATTGGFWERAQVNVGGGRQANIDDVRRCGRIIYDSQNLATLIWKRIENVPEVQEILRLENRPMVVGNGPTLKKEVWSLTRPNERMRFLKYVGGEYFRAHCDGLYETPDKTERSYFTMHLYLSPSGVPDQEQLKNLTHAQRRAAVQEATIGGATIFHSPSMKPDLDIDVAPKLGRILLFQQRDLLHSGDDVVKGVKYTMRTDLMYAREDTQMA